VLTNKCKGACKLIISPNEGVSFRSAGVKTMVEMVIIMAALCNRQGQAIVFLP